MVGSIALSSNAAKRGFGAVVIIIVRERAPVRPRIRGNRERLLNPQIRNSDEVRKQRNTSDFDTLFVLETGPHQTRSQSDHSFVFVSMNGRLNFVVMFLLQHLLN